jgi:biopolymer transport protein ExbD
VEFDRRKNVEAHLNIAPLIDVVFLLLIFFMLSSYFVMQPGIKVTLPTATTSKFYPEEDIIISITSDDRLYMNEQPVTLTSLLGQLQIVLKESKTRTVIVKADEKIDLGLAVRVMDIAREAKADGVVISTKAKEDVRK